MTMQEVVPSRWAKLPVSLAIASGLLIALVPANVWPLLLTAMWCLVILPSCSDNLLTKYRLTDRGGCPNIQPHG
jgi:hypothetical protein